ncbi:MAG: hypothetical protein ACWGO1_06250 [Anaerolineales bacterium]
MLLVALLAGALALRFYDLTDQPIDFHPTRQLRGAIIARGMYYDMLPTPTRHCERKRFLSGTPPGSTNLRSWNAW